MLPCGAGVSSHIKLLILLDIYESKLDYSQDGLGNGLGFIPLLCPRMKKTDIYQGKERV